MPPGFSSKFGSRRFPSPGASAGSTNLSFFARVATRGRLKCVFASDNIIIFVPAKSLIVD